MPSSPFAFAAPPRPVETVTTADAPRRMMLDMLLVDAGAAAPVEG